MRTTFFKVAGLMMLIGMIGSNKDLFGIDGSNIDSNIHKNGVNTPLFGIAYGPFRDGEDPGRGIYPTRDEIAEDMGILKKMAHGIRTYSVGKGMLQIVELADQEGLRVEPGAWVDANPSVSNQEIAALLEADRKFKNIDFLTVGNETLYSGRLTEHELIDYIQKVKAQTKRPVTTAEPWKLWLAHPDLTEACDLILIHVYPYLDGVWIDQAAWKVIECVRTLQKQYPNKRIVIGEAGWPTAGHAIGKATASPENQERFFRELVSLCRDEKVDLFLFEAFDEAWKSGEGDHGIHWGLYDANRQPKHGFRGLLEEQSARRSP